MIGKPYSGKLNVRFDEGELEIEPQHYASSLLYPNRKAFHLIRFRVRVCPLPIFGKPQGLTLRKKYFMIQFVG